MLTQPIIEPSEEDDSDAPPMRGIWLGVGIGLVLWAALVGVVLLARAF